MNSVALATSNLTSPSQHTRTPSKRRSRRRHASQAPVNAMMKRFQQTSTEMSRKAAGRGFAPILGVFGAFGLPGSYELSGHALANGRPSDRRGGLPAVSATNLPILALVEGRP